MKKLSRKFLSTILSLSILFSLSMPVFASDNTSVREQNDKVNLSESLSDYFKKDTLGNVIFTASLNELMALGISEHDAKVMLSFTPNELKKFGNSIDSSLLVEENINDLGYLTRGFVGLKLNLGPKIRSMNGIAAGAFAGGFVGWHLKEMAAAGPWGAGAAAAITASVAGTVGYAVTNGLRFVNVGINIPGVKWIKNVNIP